MAHTPRSVLQVIETVDVQMGEITIGQPLPSPQARRVSPFLLLHHLGPVTVRPGENPMEIGAHPHRGFAPVTFVFEGEVSHADSLGNRRMVQAGGVQWMNAGSGLVHSESAGPALVKTGGPFEIIQLWINLPAQFKMSAPTYQPLDGNQIPFHDFEGKGRLNIICGSYLDLEGPAQHPTALTVFTVELRKGGRVEIHTNPRWSALLYQLGGHSTVNDTPITGRQLVNFGSTGSALNIMAERSSRFLFVSGTPIREPVAQYGPFVMNRPEELKQAIRDYQEGKMGALPN